MYNSLPSPEGSGLKYADGTTEISHIKSPLTRGEWIEIALSDCMIVGELSPLTRGEWIEIQSDCDRHDRHLVSPHPRGVD